MTKKKAAEPASPPSAKTETAEPQVRVNRKNLARINWLVEQSRKTDMLLHERLNLESFGGGEREEAYEVCARILTGNLYNPCSIQLPKQVLESALSEYLISVERELCELGVKPATGINSGS